MPRLHFVRISEGLEDLTPRWVCDSCLAELRAIAAADPAVIVTVDLAGELR